MSGSPPPFSAACIFSGPARLYSTQATKGHKRPLSGVHLPPGTT